MQPKSWFFESINKINIPLARQTKKKREKTQINIRNGRGNIIADLRDIKVRDNKRIL